jgi:hypothetical protein
VDENIKAKRDYYEQHAFSSPSHSRSQEGGDTTESTEEDITESTYLEEEMPSLRIDCQDDPFEKAYVVWYQKGLLKWRPQSMPHGQLTEQEKEEPFSFDAVVASTNQEEEKILPVSNDEEGPTDPPRKEAPGWSPSPKTKDTPTRIRDWEKQQASRSHSWQKTRQAPLISVFASPRTTTAFS